MMRYHVRRAKTVTQGEWITIRKMNQLFTGSQIKRYYVARNEGPHPALGYHILWLLNPLEPTAEAIRWTRRPDEPVLVEYPF